MYVAEIVPFQNKNEDSDSRFEDLRRRILDSGLQLIQEILRDPKSPCRAYIILGQGQKPCQFEIDQMSEYIESMKLIVSERLTRRIAML